jgi:serine/threonine protein kinase
VNPAFTEDFPLHPVALEDEGEVFREAAERLAHALPTEDELVTGLGGSTMPARQGTEVPESQLLARLRAGRGEPVRLGAYTVTRYLDGGGAGDVFEAFVGEPPRRVAMKVLREASPRNLARFKQEFRSAQGVAHPNLVAVHELVVDEGEWFFTMEHVEGVSFLRHVRDGSSRPPGCSSRDGGPTISIEGSIQGGEELDEAEIESRHDGRAPLGLTPPASARSAARFDEPRLRRALRQLGSGICALHEAGKLHLDLNPSNVKVSAEGRVVILDFGLTRNESAELDPELCLGPSGTPPYMAPEQIDHHPCQGSDWYAFGVMLYEALTGRLPFHEGGTLGILDAKRRRDPPPPEALTLGLPEDLCRLCMDLLDRHPARRPSGSEVIARLEDARSFRGAPSVVNPSSRGGFFVGRVRELSRLEEAFEAARSEGTRSVHLSGRDGSGKSTLSKHFLRELERSGRARVLRGQCHERERLPFAALDALIDALARSLRLIPAPRRAALLPDDLPELVQLFPVLGGLGAMESARPPEHEPGARRARAIAALIELLLRLAELEPLVLQLEDLQHADRQSLLVLQTLLDRHTQRAREGSALLLMCAYDRDTGDSSPALDELGAMLARAEARRAADSIVLGPLGQSEAVALALSRLPRDGDAQAIAEAIARASGGDPSLVDQLVRWASASSSFEGPSSITLERLFSDRIAELPDHARRQLELVCLSLRPLPKPIAAALTGTGIETFASLRATRLVRRVSRGKLYALTPVHEALRAVVLAEVPRERARAVHRALAHALAAHPPADAELLAEHFLAAGDLGEARSRLEIAAAEANRGARFDREALLYERAITLDPHEPRADTVFFDRRAEALVRAGRRREAIELYLASAERASGPVAQGLRLRAAEQLLASGNIPRGVAVLRPALEGLGLPCPKSEPEARLSLALGSLRLRLRGTKLDPCAERKIPGPARARIAAAWSAGRALAPTDLRSSSVLLLESLRLSLDAGDVAFAVSGLAFAATFLPGEPGASSRDRARALLAQTSDLGAQLDEGYASLFLRGCEAVRALGGGRFEHALAITEATREPWKRFGADCPWERCLSRGAALTALAALGQLEEHARRARAFLAEARTTDNPQAEAHASLHVALDLIAHDDVTAARALAEAVFTRAARSDRVTACFHPALAMLARCDLYEDRAREALGRFDRARDTMETCAALLPAAQRIELTSVRGLATLSAAAEDRAQRASWLRAAASDARALAQEDGPHAAASAALLRAGIARVEQRLAHALAELRAAGRFCAAAKARPSAAAARRAEGVLLGGRAGRALIADADAELRALGVREPARWMRLSTGLGD